MDINKLNGIVRSTAVYINLLIYENGLLHKF